MVNIIMRRSATGSKPCNVLFIYCPVPDMVVDPVAERYIQVCGKGSVDFQSLLHTMKMYKQILYNLFAGIGIIHVLRSEFY